MRYNIILTPQAVESLRNLKADIRAVVNDAIEIYLRYEPTKTSKSRIKRLRGISRPQFRLRVNEVRIFYDVTGEVVEILSVVLKRDADAWLERSGEHDEGSGII